MPEAEICLLEQLLVFFLMCPSYGKNHTLHFCISNLKKKNVKNGFICSTKDCYWKMCHSWEMLKELVYPSVTHLAELDSVYWYRVMRQLCQAYDTKKG